MSTVFSMIWFVSLIAFIVYYTKKRKARLSLGEDSEEYRKYSKIKRIIGIVCVVSFVLGVATVPESSPGDKAQVTQPKQEQSDAQAKKEAEERKALEEKAAAEKAQQEQAAAEQRKKTLGLTNAQFDEAFAAKTTELLGSITGGGIDLSQGGKRQNGEVRDVISYESPNLVLQKWLNKDGSLNAVLVIAQINTNTDAVTFMAVAGPVMAVLNPEMDADARGALLKELLTGVKGKTNTAVRGQYKYSMSYIKDADAFMMTVNNKDE